MLDAGNILKCNLWSEENHFKINIFQNHQYALEQDHQYALDPVQVKKKLSEAQKRIEELQRDLRNAKDRERRLKKTVKSLIKELKHKNMLTKELQEELDLYSGWFTFF